MNRSNDMNCLGPLRGSMKWEDGGRFVSNTLGCRQGSCLVMSRRLMGLMALRTSLSSKTQRILCTSHTSFVQLDLSISKLFS